MRTGVSAASPRSAVQFTVCLLACSHDLTQRDVGVVRLRLLVYHEAIKDPQDRVAYHLRDVGAWREAHGHAQLDHHNRVVGSTIMMPLYQRQRVINFI